ncbi:MAG: enoyl-CoA hydratase [Gammaproteobacteria bacterium]|nr:enoyl-CoA hydratase [Gammaproteobacteria bacterium]
MQTPAANATENLEALLLRDDDAGITTLTLNRPQQYNALSEEMLTALQSALDDIAEDRSVRVVVLGAKGKAFSAGHDLKQMRANPDKSYYQALFKQCSRMMMSIVRLPQPVVARVHGMAVAAGCQLVANCDLAIASDNAQFAVSGIDLGLFCSTPSVPLSRNLTRKRAMEMLLTGGFIDAQTAQDYGLINHAVGQEKLDDAVYELARRIASKPAEPVRLGKQLFYRQIDHTLEDAYDVAGDIMACNMMLDDASEGIDAFIEKREPVWKEE